MTKIRNLRNIFKVTIWILFYLFMGELVLIFSNMVIFKDSDIRDIHSFIYHHEDIGWCSKDTELYWRLNKGRYRMGALLIGQPTFLEINSDGVRGPEISREKPRDTFRIVCLGDSTTLGWEIRYELTYEQQLQNLLNGLNKYRNFEVINAGVPGYTAYQGYMLLRRYFNQWKPDLITVYFASNDNYDAKAFYKEIENSFIRRIDEQLRVNSRLYSFFKKMYLRLLMTKHIKDKIDKRPHHLEDEFSDNLELIVDFARENNVKIILLTYPTSREIYNNEKHPFNQLIENTAGKKNCIVADLVKAFKDSKKKNLFYDDVHPTPLGYRIIAEEMAKLISQ